MSETSKDILCERLLKSLRDLDALLTSDIGRNTFDVDRDADAAETHNELRRLHRSLEQYTEKSSALLYVGFVGHFSAGKSSTINSLIIRHDQRGERLTGLHPTDKAVTLITHSTNSTSLIGAHRRGELEVGSSLVDVELLKGNVVVDTPGSGDPLVVEEMVRDFLPICDRLIYTFSAAVPLDTADLPILRKVHNDLPFLPIRFVVTRADEFRVNRLSPIANDNADHGRMNTFIGELISRLAASVQGLNVAQEDVLIIDNQSGFNTDRLAEFVFPVVAHNMLSAAQLHSHKIAYYHNSAKRIREFFSKHLQSKCSALALLISTATTTRDHYEEAVTMANSRLTESWHAQQQSIALKQKGNTEWIDKLDASDVLGSAIRFTEPLAKYIADLKDNSTQWARTTADTIRHSLTERLVADFEAHVSELRASVSRAHPVEAHPLSPLVIDATRLSDMCDPISSPSPLIADRLRRLPEMADQFVKEQCLRICDGSQRVLDALRERRVLTSLNEVVDGSINQIKEMVAGFFKSVQIYRSAVLSLNARELAEKAGIVQAIDELERKEVPDDKKEQWANRTVDEIFVNRHVVVQRADNEFAKVYDKLTTLLSQARNAPHPTGSINSRLVAEEEIGGIELSRNDGLFQVLRRIIGAFNDVSSDVFQHLRDKRDLLLAERREQLRIRMELLARRRVKRLVLCAGLGSAIGLLVYGGFYLWQKPFSGNWAASILVGIAANAVTAFCAWAVGWLTDRSSNVLDTVNDDHIRESRAIVDDLLRENREFDRTRVFSERDRNECESIIAASWRDAIDRVVMRILSEPYVGPFGQVTSNVQLYRECRMTYVEIAHNLAKDLTSFFARTEDNLKALAKVSAEIREEAIVPSFSMLQRRSAELSEQLTLLTSIELS